MASTSQPESVPQDLVSSQSPDLFRQVSAYSFSNDREFQQGLRAILDSASSPEETDALTLDAQCFYYARKHALPRLDVDAYRAWLQSQPPNDETPSAIINPLSSQEPTIIRNPSAENSGINEPISSSIFNQAGAAATPMPSPPPAPYPTSFSQIVDLITNGQPIPGIKEVPDTLLSGQESRAVTAKRKKPWERDEGHGHVDDVVARTDALT
ncbi:hypothetical protein MMC22_002146 [Lobaria immixta]|nr:hypothetical protein [Lobaria immixta]